MIEVLVKVANSDVGSGVRNDGSGSSGGGGCGGELTVRVEAAATVGVLKKAVALATSNLIAQSQSQTHPQPQAHAQPLSLLPQVAPAASSIRLVAHGRLLSNDDANVAEALRVPGAASASAATDAEHLGLRAVVHAVLPVSLSLAAASTSTPLSPPVSSPPTGTTNPNPNPNPAIPNLHVELERMVAQFHSLTTPTLLASASHPSPPEASYALALPSPCLVMFNGMPHLLQMLPPVVTSSPSNASSSPIDATTANNAAVASSTDQQHQRFPDNHSSFTTSDAAHLKLLQIMQNQLISAQQQQLLQPQQQHMPQQQQQQHLQHQQPQQQQPQQPQRNLVANIMRHINAFLNDPEDEFVDAAAAVAAVAAANNNNNQELFAAAENPLYVAIKLIILVAMITRGHIYNRQSAIIISFCLAYFTWALRKWYIQQYPHAVRVNGVVAQPQRPIANIVPAAAAAADTPAVVPLDGQGINTTVYQDVFYFVHDFFASLVPGMDDRLYNREQPQPHDAGVGAAGGVAVDAFQG